MKPDGSRSHPVRSCRDITDYYPTKPNGFYFIDPNEGSKNDAVLVYCKLTQRLTCVNATNGLIQSHMFSKNRIHYGKNIRLLGDLQQSELIYDMETIQLRFLRILSEQGSQTVIFNCHSGNIDVLKHDIKLRTKNGMIYRMHSLNDDSLRYNIIKDDCK
ncbi:unnamed protein product, partial [Rotaria magnacalcarata]